MVVKFRKKARRMRGKGTHGFGSKKKHRGGGSQGGRGFAGSHKHKYIMISIQRPEHFGHRGFHSLKNKNKTINLIDVDKLALSHGKKEIDLNALGYDKLLAKGRITSPLTIHVNNASQRAASKVEKAGGKIITVKKDVKRKKSAKEQEE